MRRDLLRVGLAALGGVVGLANGEDEIKLYAWVRGEARPTTATQSYNDGEDIDITVDNTVTIIQVIADNPLLHSIGHITIRSDRGPNNQLRLLIAGSGSADIEDQPDTAMTAAYLHWAGVHALDIGDPETTPGEATDTGRSLIVAAAINGNFTQGSSADGRIEAGHIYRLQSQSDVTGSGNLSIPVWGYGPSGSFDTIGMIDVVNSVAALVRADNTLAAHSSEEQNIFRIRVGPGASASGISGRILCPKGTISQITSTGPISIPTTGDEPGIHAGRRIEWIYAGEPTSDQNHAPTQFIRHIEATILCRRVVTSGEVQIRTGTLQRLTTGGDLAKPVHALEITADGPRVSCGEEFGIRVGGAVTAPITVDERVFVAVISADTFAEGAHVTIGHFLKGTIEARGAAGNLRNVSVGRGPNPPANYGMSGWEGTCPGPNLVDPPSVIRAAMIDFADVARMYLFPDKEFPPRIEAESIGALVIGEMFTGEVRGHPAGSDEYTIIGAALIDTLFGGDIGRGPVPPAVVRCESFTAFNVTEDHGGELYFKAIPVGRVPRIGGRMQSSGGSLDAVEREGLIRIDTAQSLHGPVVINAEGAPDPSPADYCSGPVVIENGTTDISLSAATSTGNINTMPEYTRASDTVGGGAVGLAPFSLYDEDCDPVSGATGEDALLQSEFDNVSTDSVPTRPVIIRFYGPVRTGLATDSPVDLYLRKVLNNTISFTRMPRDSYTVEVNRPGSTGANREIRLYGAGQYRFSSGQYHIRPRESGPPQLYCDFVKFNPAVRDFDYIFTLRYDCDHDGVEDQPGDCDTNPNCPCPADYNEDGGVDGSDVAAFFIAWEGGEADTNCDGGTDGRDVETYFIAWEAGGC